MTATSTPKMTLTYSHPSPADRATSVYAVIEPADGGETTVVDLEFSDYLVETVTKVAEAFGAQVVEVNEFARPERGQR